MLMLSPVCYRAEDLRNIGERFGEVRDVYIPRNFYTQMPRGFAFIEFTEPRACEDAAHDLQGFEIEGKPVRPCLPCPPFYAPNALHAPAPTLPLCCPLVQSQHISLQLACTHMRPTEFQTEHPALSRLRPLW